MEQLIYELNGIKYLLVELYIKEATKAAVDNVVNKYDGIYQGIKELHKGGLLSEGYAIIKYLIPERNIILFNKESI